MLDFPRGRRMKAYPQQQLVSPTPSASLAPDALMDPQALMGNATMQALLLPWLSGCTTSREDEDTLRPLIDDASSAGVETRFMEETLDKSDVSITDRNAKPYFDFGYPLWYDRGTVEVSEPNLGLLAHESTHDYLLRHMEREDVKGIMESTAASFEGQEFAPRSDDDAGGAISGSMAYTATQEGIASYAHWIIHSQTSAVDLTRSIVDDLEKDSDFEGFSKQVGYLRTTYGDAMSGAGDIELGTVEGMGKCPPLPDASKIWVRETLLKGKIYATYDDIPGVRAQLDRARTFGYTE